MPRISLLPIAVAMALAIAPAAGAQPAAASKAAVDPRAVAALQSMASYLRALKAFQVDAVTTTDDVLETGQKIQSSGGVRLVARMPDRLFADVATDRFSRRFYYDGKSLTMWARRMGFYATVAAPPTLKELDQQLSDDYGIEIPLADLFRFGDSSWQPDSLLAAIDVGPSAVGGVSCAHYAFRQADVDFEIWIQQGEYPLPRKLVITSTQDASQPQHSATYAWNLAPSFNDDTFAFKAPAGASRIVLTALTGEEGQ